MSSVFRLETFAPGSQRAPQAQLRAQAAREEAWREGFIAGQAAATESFLEDQARLTSELVEAISDARLTNDAARRHVAASLAPMVASLCRAVAPALAEAGLAGEVARLVARAVEAAPQARPRLRCAPELAPTLGAMLAQRRLAAEIEAAPELLPREAQVFWDQGYDHLDLDACIAQVEACIASHLETPSEGKDDDPRRHG